MVTERQGEWWKFDDSGATYDTRLLMAITLVRIHEEVG